MNFDSTQPFFLIKTFLFSCVCRVKDFSAFYVVKVNISLWFFI